jgi:hypothetical protein
MGGAGAFSDEPGFFPGLKGDLPSPLDNIVLPGVEPKRFQYVEVPHANRLGGGAFGDVILGRHLPTGELLALKRVPIRESPPVWTTPYPRMSSASCSACGWSPASPTWSA